MTVWGTDVKRNSTIVDRSGLYALEFMANRAGVMETGYRPVAPLSPYRFIARVQTSLIGVNDTIVVTARFYDNAKTFISADTVFSGVLSAANAWLEVVQVFNAPATTAFAAVRIQKDSTATAYIAYCDFAEVAPIRRGFFAKRTSNQILTATGTTIQFNVEIYDDGSVYNATGSTDAKGISAWSWRAENDGYYAVAAYLQFNGVDDNNNANVVVYLNGALMGNDTRWSPGASNAVTPHVVIPKVKLNLGDQIRVLGAYSGSGSKTVVGTANPNHTTWFSVTEVF